MYNYLNSGAGGGSAHFRGNGLDNGNGTGNPQTSYGIRSFQSSLDAHAFINTALNSGAGFVGTVAGGMEFLPNQGPRNPHIFSNNFGPAFNGSHNNSGLSVQPYVGTGSGMTGILERRLQVHPLSSRVFHQRPTPASGLVIYAEVQSSQSGTGGTSTSSPYPGSPPSSISSYRSGGSHGGCSCGCVCNLYCDEHAYKKCPVHGLGLQSSDEGSPRSLTGHSHSPSLSCGHSPSLSCGHSPSPLLHGE